MRISMRMIRAGALAVAASVIVPIAPAPAEAICAVPPDFQGDPPPCHDVITREVPQPGNGLLVIAQATDPPDPQMFSFTMTGAFESSFELDGDEARPPEPRMFHVPAGPYTVTQSPVPTWPLISISCTNADGASVGRTAVSARRATVTLSDGGRVTCRFVNERASAAKSAPAQSKPVRSARLPRTGGHLAALGTAAAVLALAGQGFRFCARRGRGHG